MELCRYTSENARETRDLFWQTVHFVNDRDYTPKQLDAWATKEYDIKEWNDRLMSRVTYIIKGDKEILGFASLDPEGLLDHLFVHKDHQHQGIGTILCQKMESICPKDLYTYASITARPFFLHRGYHELQKRTVIVRGVSMDHYKMCLFRKNQSFCLEAYRSM